MDLVGDWFPVDRISDLGVLDFKGAILVEINIIATGCLDNSFLTVIARPVWVEIAPWHWYNIVIYKAIAMTINHGIHSEGEDMLMVYSKYTRMDHCTPRHFYAII